MILHQYDQKQQNRVLEEVNDVETDSTEIKSGTNNSSEVLRNTLRLYGSVYILSLFVYTILRRFYPKLFNIRSWVPAIQCELAQRTDYTLPRHVFSWMYKVFEVQDQEIFEQCGMDTLCFLRALQFGRKLSIVGCLNALYLIPLYATANDSTDTSYITDLLVMMSASNLPSASPRFIAPVIAVYLSYLYTMNLILCEYRWYSSFRHQFLSQRKPQNYTCYVSGIPSDYRSSYKLLQYFQQCTGGFSSGGSGRVGGTGRTGQRLYNDADTQVLEAHVAIDTPKLDKLVARRDIVVQNLEHTVQLENMTGKTSTHILYDTSLGIRRTNSVTNYQNELDYLNQAIRRSVQQIMQVHDQYRSQFKKFRPSRNLLCDGDSFSSQVSNNDKINSNNVINEQIPTRSFEEDPLLGDFNSNDKVGTNDNFGVSQKPVSIKNLRLGSEKTLYLEPISEVDIEMSPSSVSQSHDIDDDEEITKGDQKQASPISTLTLPADDELKVSNIISVTEVLSDRNIRHSTERIQSSAHKRPSLMDSYQEIHDLLKENECQKNHVTSRSCANKNFGAYAEVEMQLVEESIRSVSNDIVYSSPSPNLPTEPEHIDTIENPLADDVVNNVATHKRQSIDDILFGEFGTEDDGTKYNASNSSSKDGLSIASVINATLGAKKRFASKTKALRSTASMSITSGSRVASQSILGMSRKTGETLTRVSRELHADKIVQSAGGHIEKTTEQAKQVGNHLITSASAVVPILVLKTEGQSKDAGFVVFKNLYSTQAAIQMIHHPEPYVMEVVPAPAPDDIYWRNVGLPHRARRWGRIASFAATTVLCIFWTVPTGIISSLTEVQSLKQSLPKLGEFIDTHPFMERVLAQLAPLILMFFTEIILPALLKWFATWEGHVSSVMLDASLFVKLGVFVIIQTFFVSAISGGISAEISNILANPESIIEFLAVSLPAQSTYFIQLAVAYTFFFQTVEMLRLYPLSLAFLRRFFGPNLTPRERQQSWFLLHSLEDPPEFWHAETFAQLILLYMVTFVYLPIAPITCFFLLFCFTLVESGYRYQLIHNYSSKFDSGGRLWKYWIRFTLTSMIIAQLTLIGLFTLKKSKYAGPALGPLLGITILFAIYINSKHSDICEFLPTRECVIIDCERNVDTPMDMDFVANAYLQPSLQATDVVPNFDEGVEYYALTTSDKQEDESKCLA